VRNFDAIFSFPPNDIGEKFEKIFESKVNYTFQMLLVVVVGICWHCQTSRKKLVE